MSNNYKKNKVRYFFCSVIDCILFVRKVINQLEVYSIKNKLGNCAKSADIRKPRRITAPEKIYLYKKVNINKDSVFIISPHSCEGKFIMKEGAAAGHGLTIITNTHGRSVGSTFKNSAGLIRPETDINSDIVVEEDVWIGANVTILPGVNIGRGANIGAGAVVRNSIPPYAIVIGNPAKIIGFTFTPEEIMEHEKILYPEPNRLPKEMIEKNYKKYFLERLKEIKEYSGLVCK